MSQNQLNRSIGQYQIRSWVFDDENDIVKYADNPNIAKNLRDGFPSPYTKADAQSFLTNVINRHPLTIFAIATSSEAIGAIGLTIGKDVHRLTAELGYWLGEPFWGKGIMTLAVKAISEMAFKEFDLHRIYAEPYASNPASARVLEKAGFQCEGRLRASVIKNNKILDQLLYSKINDKIESSDI